jgi:E3 ubiquitin-protein ligase SHPRH
VVFDEAQMVGGNGGHSATSTMGQRILARHRWCVTGTPIGPGGLDDVMGLLRVLHAAPFDAAPGVFRVS